MLGVAKFVFGGPKICWGMVGKAELSAGKQTVTQHVVQFGHGIDLTASRFDIVFDTMVVEGQRL